MDEGYDTPEEDKTASVTPAKMTINQMKDWLTENGHEEKVWTLTNAKAKKPRSVLLRISMICGTLQIQKYA